MAGRWTILEQVISRAQDGLPPEVARYLLTLDFSPAEHARYGELAAKAQDGSLSPEERAEIEGFLDVNDLLAIVQSKARISSAKHTSAA